MAMSGCARRTTISDEVLARIFRDAFISNAYVTTNGISLDSLRLYEPIFNSYGYTIEDVQYTLGSFAMRKSARLGDVVESAISMLERRGVELDREVAILDTIDKIVVRRTTEHLFLDSLLRLDKWSDTTELQRVFLDPSRGRYKVRMNYSLVTPPKDRVGYRLEMRTEITLPGGACDGSDSIAVLDRRNVSLRKNSAGSLTESNIVVGDSVERLIIELAKVSNWNEESIPNLEIRDVEMSKVISVDDSRDVIFDQYVSVKIFGDEFLFTKDSL